MNLGYNQNTVFTVIQTVLIVLVSSIIFLFIFWKRLKEDYTQGQIFTTGFYSIAGIGIAALLAGFWLKAWWFWLIFLGSLLGMIIGLYRYKMRFYEVFEASYIGLLPSLAFFFLIEAVRPTLISMEMAKDSYSMITFSAFVVTVLLLGLFYYLDTHYKNFSWYKSGKIGFSGIMTLAIFFLLRSAVASFFPFVVSFVGNYESILSGLVSLTLFSLIYKLAK